MALIAAGLVALGALVPALVSSEPAAATTLSSPAQISGALICLECELARRQPRPGLEASLRRRGSGAGSVGPAGAAVHGRLHLRDDAGRVWSVLTRPSEGVDPLGDHSFAGQRATAFGILEPALHAIDASRLELR